MLQTNYIKYWHNLGFEYGAYLKETHSRRGTITITKNCKHMKHYESLIDALDDLKNRGYEADFGTEQVCLYCGDLDLRLNPGSFNVDEVYRFGGDSNPDDSSVVYAISSSTGVKGTLVDAYGAYVGNLNLEIQKKLQAHYTVMD